MIFLRVASRKKLYVNITHKAAYSH